MRFGTKADNLRAVFNQLNTAKTLPVFHFTVEEWNQKNEEICNRMASLKWINSPVAVRSSAWSEDGVRLSNAGMYKSVLNILGIDSIKVAIEEVISSYGSMALNDQVFLQPMITAAKINSVVFTMDPNNGGNYYIVNFDKTSCATDTVTSGNGNSINFYKFKGYFLTTGYKDMDKIIALAQELEAFFNYEALDIEFCQTEDQEIVLLQVRPLVMQIEAQPIEEQKVYLERINKYLKSSMCSKPYLHGKNTIYSNMQDWNPAEMIGVRPRPLALIIV